MSDGDAALCDTPPFRLTMVEDYAPLVGDALVERTPGKAARLRDRHVAHIDSTDYGGGVAQILTSLTLLMNASGLPTEWRVIEGAPDFFSVTKKTHNALQGEAINLSKLKMRIHEEVAFENAARLHLDHDSVLVHDPLPLLRYCRKTVTEAMRKGAAVVAGNVGGIKHQIVDGESGFLVDSVDAAAARILPLLQDPNLRRRLGRAAQQIVREKFLLTRLLEDWLDLLGAFRARYELMASAAA